MPRKNRWPAFKGDQVAPPSGENSGWDADAPLVAGDGEGKFVLNGKPAIPDVITQEMLTEYQQLKALAEKVNSLGDRLKAALEAGAPVEPGPLAAMLQRRTARYLTVGHIIKELGLAPEKVNSLRASAELRVSRILTVRER